LEAGQQVLAVENSAPTEELSLSGAMADLHAFLVRVITQEICVPLAKKSFSRSSISARVFDGRKDFHCRSGARRNLRVEGVNPKLRKRAFG